MPSLAKVSLDHYYFIKFDGLLIAIHIISASNPVILLEESKDSLWYTFVFQIEISDDIYWKMKKYTHDVTTSFMGISLVTIGNILNRIPWKKVFFSQSNNVNYC